MSRPLEYQHGQLDEPWAVRCSLDWTVSGPLPKKIVSSLTSCHSSVHHPADFDLNEQTKTWWDNESYGSRVKVDGRSRSDVKALKTLEKTTHCENDRYNVGMLWNSPRSRLPNNYRSAVKQFLSLENRLAKNPEIKDAYSDTIKTDKDSGYIWILEPTELQETKNEPQWYLPHHPVINPNKPGKVRCVCIAASEFEGHSLNKSLFIGPDLLQNSVGIIFRFREKPFGMSADIEAMFLQVQVPPEDAKCLRFIWRENQSDDISTYEYTRYIFGAKDSPTCVNYALQRTATDNEEAFPVASRIVKRYFYMYDFSYSAENIQEAESVNQNLISLLQKGGFKFSRWQSNVKELCKKDSDLESVTALGLEWNLISDDLKLCRGFAGEEHTIITHRVYLSVASSIFDPLGLASPFTIRNRPILRLIWQKALKSWEEEIPQDVAKQYLEWLQEIPALKELSINRYYDWQRGSNVELHVFADVSEMGLCVVAYLRFEIDGKLKVSFVMGKTRVAPTKTTTIPKLELQAALHASRIKVSIIEEHDFTINQIFRWSDSSTVIQWLNAFEKKQQIFVENRIGEFLENTKLGEWNQNPGAQNPADLGTRGMRANEIASSVWLNGPAWLIENEAHWPKGTAACTNVKDTSETSQVVTLLPNKLLEIQWERFSSWTKLIHTICYILRWRRRNQKRGVISLDEYHYAERITFKLSQKESFTTEYDTLVNGKEVSSKSNIAQLCPFIDNQGIMRASGRLSKADFEFDTKPQLFCHPNNLQHDW